MLYVTIISDSVQLIMGVSVIQGRGVLRMSDICGKYSVFHTGGGRGYPPRNMSPKNGDVSSMELRELEHPPQSYDKNNYCISNVTTYLSLALYFTLKIDLHFSMLLIKCC